MRNDYFDILGLAPLPQDPAAVDAHYALIRHHLRRRLADPAACRDALQELDRAHAAWAVLRDPARQAEYLARFRSGDPLAHLRQMVRDSLEDGLLRHSRRQAILAAGRDLGLSEFRVHLLIAETQFEDESAPASTFQAPARLEGSCAALSEGDSEAQRTTRRVRARIAAAGMLAAAMFVALVRWVGP